MLPKGYIDFEGTIQYENIDKLYEEYPEAVNNLRPNKIIDGNKKKNYVKVRKDKFSDIRSLWNRVNQKYYLKFEDISEDELSDVLYDIFDGDIYI